MCCIPLLCLLILIIPLKAQGLTLPSLAIWTEIETLQYIMCTSLNLWSLWTWGRLVVVQIVSEPVLCQCCLWRCKACEHLSPIRTPIALMTVQTPNKKVVCVSKSHRSGRHQPLFILEKLTLQAQVSVSLYLTMHVLEYFSVQGDKCSTYYRWHFCLAEEMKFRDTFL